MAHSFGTSRCSPLPLSLRIPAGRTPPRFPQEVGEKARDRRRAWLEGRYTSVSREVWRSQYPDGGVGVEDRPRRFAQLRRQPHGRARHRSAPLEVIRSLEESPPRPCILPGHVTVFIFKRAAETNRFSEQPVEKLSRRPASRCCEGQRILARDQPSE